MGNAKEPYDPTKARTHFKKATGFDVDDALVAFAHDVATNVPDISAVAMAVRAAGRGVRSAVADLDGKASKRGVRSAVADLDGKASKRGVHSAVADLDGKASKRAISARLNAKLHAVDASATSFGMIHRLIAEEVTPLERTGFVRTPQGKGRPTNTALRDFIYVYDYVRRIAGRPELTQRQYVAVACALNIITPRLKRGAPDRTQYARAFADAADIPSFDIRDRSTYAAASPARYLAAEVSPMITIIDRGQVTQFRDPPSDEEFVLWITWRHSIPKLWPWRQLRYERVGSQYALALLLPGTPSEANPAGRSIEVELRLPCPTTDALRVVYEAIDNAQRICLRLIASGGDNIVERNIRVHITAGIAPLSPAAPTS